jgi:serine/threonine protein kinase
LSEVVGPVRPGEIVGGKYRVERTLGSGGMGIVVAATHIELERPVALKFLLPRVLERRDVVARFAREARAVAQLQSEHVARVLDVGALEDGAPYIVMEYLEGEDLAQVLASEGPLACDRAAGYVLEASEAIAEAHALGIIHRDLKPANLFLARRRGGPPAIKVLDFGLSKFSGLAENQHVTSVSSVLGSPAYMSPEQLLSAPTADARSDIWSLGVVLYELLTARTPFRHERMPELVAAILHKTERPIEEVRSDVPPELEALVRRCLEKDPARRFPSMAHLAAALAAFGPPESDLSVQRINKMLGVQPTEAVRGGTPSLRVERPAVVESVSGSSRTIRGSPATALTPTLTAERRRERKGPVLGIVGALVALAAAGSLALGMRPTKPPEAQRGAADARMIDKREGMDSPAPVASARPAEAPSTDGTAGITTRPYASNAAAAPIASGLAKDTPKRTKSVASASTSDAAAPREPPLPAGQVDPLGRLRPL